MIIFNIYLQFDIILFFVHSSNLIVSFLLPSNDDEEVDEASFSFSDCLFARIGETTATKFFFAKSLAETGNCMAWTLDNLESKTF